MRTASIAFSWEYWRRGAFTIGLICVAMTGAMFLVYWGIWNAADSRWDADHRAAGEDRVLQNALLLMATLQVVCAPMLVNGSLDRKRTLPASAWAIVGWPLAWGCFTAASMYLGLAALLNVWVEPDWPLWGPALLIAATYAIAQTIGWSLRRSPTLMIVAGVSEIALLGFWSAALPTDELGQTTWNAPTFGEAAILLAVIGAAYLASVAAFTHRRRGGRLDLAFLAEALFEWWENRLAFESASRERRVFATPARALVWKEWREKGIYLPLILAAITIGSSLIFAVGWANPQLPIEWLMVVFSVGYMALPLIGIYLGHASSTMSLPLFRATQPVSDGAIARAVLLNVALVLAASLVVWLLGGALALACASLGNGNLEPFYRLEMDIENVRAAQRAPFAIPLTLGCVSAWILCSTGAWLAMARKEWFFAAIICCPTLFIIGVAYVSFLVPEPAQEVVTIALWSVASAVIALATAAAFAIAAKRGLISLWLCGGALLSWLAICGLLAAQVFYHLPIETPSIALLVLLAGFATLAVAPFATAPLAVSYNRRR